MIDKRSRNISLLRPYLPPDTAELVYDIILHYRIRFRISKSRNSRFGDYQSPELTGIHKISVNHDLNPYAFLITFCHEVAHLVQWEKYRHKVAPHGNEWKEEFRLILFQFISMDIFPQDIEYALENYILNPKASSCSDQELYRTLKKYDVIKILHLEELPIGSIFRIKGNDKIFKKGKRQRTRYLCECINEKRIYTVSAIAEVTVLSEALNLV